MELQEHPDHLQLFASRLTVAPTFIISPANTSQFHCAFYKNRPCKRSGDIEESFTFSSKYCQSTSNGAGSPACVVLLLLWSRSRSPLSYKASRFWIFLKWFHEVLMKELQWILLLSDSKWRRCWALLAVTQRPPAPGTQGAPGPEEPTDSDCQESEWRWFLSRIIAEHLLLLQSFHSVNSEGSICSGSSNRKHQFELILFHLEAQRIDPLWIPASGVPHRQRRAVLTMQK